MVADLPASSVAVMEKVRVVRQPVWESRCVTLVPATRQSSLTWTSARTLASVGKSAAEGLQPIKLPEGTTVMIGGEVSANVICWMQLTTLPHAPVFVPLADAGLAR